MISNRSFAFWHLLVWLAAMPLAMAGDGTPAGAFGNKRLLAIGIDGLRSDALQAGDTPKGIAGSRSHRAAADGDVTSRHPHRSGVGWGK